ncbi:hypothetical protein [Moraxella catarrhalis]|uniref:hypothetical protein n=1 Tax=Moraxella catarrhalis TaxID=480 RepID=UPI001D0DB7C0|nr:hypothetical protein [Moraxella catarrhalis]
MTEDSDVVVRSGALIDERLVEELDATAFDEEHIRSVITCEATQGVCAKSYGRDLDLGRLGNIGVSVGVVSAL